MKIISGTGCSWLSIFSQLVSKRIKHLCYARVFSSILQIGREIRTVVVKKSITQSLSKSKPQSKIMKQQMLVLKMNEKNGNSYVDEE